MYHCFEFFSGTAMAQKIAMTSPMNPVHVDLLIVTITILNALTKNASTKVLFATVKMTVETNLMNLPVMVSINNSIFCSISFFTG